MLILENRILVHLQRCFRQRQMLKSLENSLEFLSNLSKLSYICENENCDSFDKLTKYIRNKDIVNQFKQFIDKYYLFAPPDKSIVNNRLNPRSLLSAWVFVGFPQVVLDVDKHKITDRFTPVHKKDMYRHSVNLITQLEKVANGLNNMENIRHLVKNMNIYSNCFYMFMQYDKIEKINGLIEEWYNVQSNIKLVNDSTKYAPDQKDEVINQIGETANKIEKFIQTLSPDFDLGQLSRYRTLCDKIHHNFNRAYKDSLHDDISSGEYKMFTRVLDEIKSKLSHLAQGNRQICSQLDEYVDNDWIVENLKSANMTKSQSMNIVEFIKQTINQLESPAQTVDTDKLYHDLESKVDQDDISLSNLLVNSVMFTLERISQIEQSIINLSVMNSLGINPFGLS